MKALPTDRERKIWWHRIYAHTSFCKALQTCELILKHTKSTSHPLYSPLNTALHAFYGRPFKKLNSFPDDIRLTRDFIPTRWRGLHDALIVFRDKVLLHTDPESPVSDWLPFHDVAYTREKGHLEFSTADPSPQLLHFAGIKKLLPVLIQKTHKEIQRFHRRYLYLLPKRDGIFQLQFGNGALFTDHPNPHPVRDITFPNSA